MEIIKKISRKISRKFYKKQFSSFKNAYEYCNQKTNGVYESELICRYRFQKLNNFLKENGNLLNNPGMTNLLFSINYYLKNFDEECPALIDFGGACGESLLILEKIFGKEITSKSYIIESPQQVKESRNWNYSSRLNFSYDIKNILENKNLSIFFSSGTIQYLEDPFKMVSQVAKSSIKVASFTRNNFALNNKIYIQKSYLSENGTGKHIKEFEDIPMYYPNRSILKKELIDIFIKNNFKIIVDSEENNGVFGKENYGGDLIFAKNN